MRWDERWTTTSEALAEAEHREHRRRGDGDQVFTISPPFGCSTWPVMYDASAEARNT